MVQKIQRIPLRKAFPHEARDFTRWLEENIDVLNDCLDITADSRRALTMLLCVMIDIVMRITLFDHRLICIPL